jgi:hypothetical protein
VAREDIERTCIAGRDQFQHPDFRRAKSGASRGKFFEQRNDITAQLRKRTQIPRQQIEPGFRRRRAPRCPGEARRVEVIVADWNSLGPPFRQIHVQLIADAGVGLDQAQF